jgi:hypothetical protein
MQGNNKYLCGALLALLMASASTGHARALAPENSDAVGSGDLNQNRGRGGVPAQDQARERAKDQTKTQPGRAGAAGANEKTSVRKSSAAASSAGAHNGKNDSVNNGRKNHDAH